MKAEGITLSSVFLLQPPSVFGSELNTPKPDGLVADCDSTLRWKIFNEWSGIPAMTQIESIVEPDSIRHDIWREPMALVGIHWPILLESVG